MPGDIIIHTRIGAYLILNGDEGTITIPAARNGKLLELVAAAPANNVKVTGNITRVNTNEENRATKQVSTAAARADDKSE